MIVEMEFFAEDCDDDDLTVFVASGADLEVRRSPNDASELPLVRYDAGSRSLLVRSAEVLEKRHGAFRQTGELGLSYVSLGKAAVIEREFNDPFESPAGRAVELGDGDVVRIAENVRLRVVRRRGAAASVAAQISVGKSARVGTSSAPPVVSSTTFGASSSVASSTTNRKASDLATVSPTGECSHCSKFLSDSKPFAQLSHLSKCTKNLRKVVKPKRKAQHPQPQAPTRIVGSSKTATTFKRKRLRASTSDKRTARVLAAEIKALQAEVDFASKKIRRLEAESELLSRRRGWRGEENRTEFVENDAEIIVIDDENDVVPSAGDVPSAFTPYPDARGLSNPLISLESVRLEDSLKHADTTQQVAEILKNQTGVEISSQNLQTQYESASLVVAACEAFLKLDRASVKRELEMW